MVNGYSGAILTEIDPKEFEGIAYGNYGIDIYKPEAEILKQD